MRRNQQAILDDINYYNDPRTRAARGSKWYKSFNENNMTALVEFTHFVGKEETEESIVFSVRFDICHLCRGKGTHVNPSIDCGGLTQDDWDCDPYFEDEYFSGSYDMPCNECNAKRVVPVMNRYILTDEQKRVVEIMDKLAQEAEENYAEMIIEMKMV